MQIMSSTSHSKVSISLVVATVGRVHELDRMLTSMATQSWLNFELIIVDQNTDERVEQLLASKQLPIECIYVRSTLGASKSRNIGINIARGDVIGFPDDDCWYPPDLLAQVMAWFDHNSQHDFLCCRAQDENGNPVASRWPRYSIAITRASVLRACACSALFMRRHAAIQADGFDETMGPGPQTIVKSAEEIDFVLRMMERAKSGWFDKDLYIYHPHKEVGSVSSERAYIYGVGFGFLLRKHHYPVHILGYHVVRPLAGMMRALFSASPQEMLFYWKSALGRLTGYLGPLSSKSNRPVVDNLSSH